MKEIDKSISLDELLNIYLPLARIINLYVNKSKKKDDMLEHTFKACIPEKVPYIIGISGGVGVGKSTTAKILQILLSKWPVHQKVNIIPADSFLYPNQALENKERKNRKGLPESRIIKV